MLQCPSGKHSEKCPQMGVMRWEMVDSGSHEAWGAARRAVVRISLKERI